MLENKDYCDYELRLELRDIGYPMSTCQINDGPIQMPKITLYEAQKFLREEKGIIVGIINNFTTKEFDYYVSTWEEDRCTDNEYTSYENALLRGIKKAVEILKE